MIASQAGSLSAQKPRPIRSLSFNTLPFDRLLFTMPKLKLNHP
jgi:hypothetical protein